MSDLSIVLSEQKRRTPPFSVYILHTVYYAEFSLLFLLKSDTYFTNCSAGKGFEK